MTKQLLAIQVLTTLYRAASRGQLLTESSLAQLVGVDLPNLLELLSLLDRGGYVQRQQLRLTMVGLTIAVAASKKTNRRTLANAA